MKKKKDSKINKNDSKNFETRRWFGTGSGGATIVKDPPPEKKKET